MSSFHETPQGITIELAMSYLRNNVVPPERIPEVLRFCGQAVSDMMSPAEEPIQELAPAVPVKKSVTPDYIICLEDGKKLKMLKRHLKQTYNMTPAEYRAKWGLAADYPMVAPNYAKRRSELAKVSGLGKREAA